MTSAVAYTVNQKTSAVVEMVNLTMCSVKECITNLTDLNKQKK